MLEKNFAVGWEDNTSIFNTIGGWYNINPSVFRFSIPIKPANRSFVA